MTDDEQGVRDPVAAQYGAHRDVPQDDRRDVRSDADGTLPDEKPPVATADEADRPADDGAAATEARSGSAEKSDENSDSGKTSDKKSGSFWRGIPGLGGLPPGPAP